MATQVTLPRLSPGMNEASVGRWLKKSGDRVAAGEDLFEVETEKVATMVQAAAGGILTIAVPEGRTVEIGTVLAIIAEAGETPAAMTSGVGSDVQAARVVIPPTPEPSAPIAAGDESRVIASPAARRLARELGLDIAAVVGSGPGGRIIEKDVQEAAARHPMSRPAAPAAPPSAAPIATGSGAALTGVRRVIAERMVLSQRTAASVTVTMDVAMGSASDLRQQLIAEWEQREGVRVTFTDIIVKAAGKALLEHRRVNSRLDGDRIVESDAAHIGVAVALDDGLIVPVLRDVQRKTILEIGRETRDLAARAREGRVTVAEVTGGTFTISNIGTTGADIFTPIINPPESAILGVGRIAPRPYAAGEKVEVGPMMWLSLTFDHRIIDGHPAALFLARVREILEKPYLLFV